MEPSGSASSEVRIALKVIAWLLGGVAIALFMVSLASKPSPSPTRLPPPGIGAWPVATAAPGLSEYLHPTGAFYLQYPADWQVMDTPEAATITDSLQRAQVYVTFAGLDAELEQEPLEEMVSAFARASFGQHPGFEVAETWHLPDESVLATASYARDDGEVVAITLLGEVHAPVIYYQGFVAAARWYDRYLTDFRSMAESFRYDVEAAERALDNPPP